jgi:hypothetical protein
LTKINISQFETFSEFEIYNLLRDSAINATGYKLKLLALDHLNSSGELEDILSKSLKNKTFREFYMRSDLELVNELVTEKIPYQRGLNHISAAIIMAYLVDETYPDEGLKLINEFIPNFNLNMLIK